MNNEHESIILGFISSFLRRDTYFSGPIPVYVSVLGSVYVSKSVSVIISVLVSVYMCICMMYYYPVSVMVGNNGAKEIHPVVQ